MNEPPPIVPSAPRLHLRRCVRHPSREAAARCPACGEFYCRECVVEHEGRLLCATCLGKRATGAATRRIRWTAMRRAGGMCAGAGVLWLSWYLLGATLVRIPPSYHEGTVWRALVERRNP